MWKRSGAAGGPAAGRYDPKVGKGVFAVRLKKNNSNFVEPASSIWGEEMHIGRNCSESSM